MAVPSALHLALDLAAMPVLAGVMRRQKPPADLLVLIKIAGRCAETCREAERLTGERPEAIREAAMLYLQTMLFTDDADHYRVLGVEPDAPQEVIGQHMRWLMKWLHPDHGESEWQSAFAERVSSAWQDLKSPERRAAYDRHHRGGKLSSSYRSSGHRRQRRRLRIPWIGAPRQVKRTPPARGWRLALAVAAGVVALATLLLAVWTPPWPTWRQIGSEFDSGEERAIDAAAIDGTAAGGTVSAGGGQ